jgi:hypothetical protein
MDVYAPFDSGPGSSIGEDTWRKIMRRPTVSGVLRNVLNELLVYADSTGMQVKVKTGEVWMEGEWGTITIEKIVPIATAHATLARIDRIVARADYVANQIVVDVLTGTAGSGLAIGCTRNTAMYEVSLATIAVPATDVSIDAAQVTDARQFGGVPYSCVTDDQNFYTDKLSSVSRAQCNGTVTLTASFLYLERMVSQAENSISEIRVFPTVAQVGGTSTWGIYKGYTQRDLALVASGSINLTVADAVARATFTAITLEAGMQICVALLTAGASTIASIACLSAVVSGNFTNPLTPVSARTSVFKSGGTIGSTLDMLDGTYSSSTTFRWMALK